MTTKNKSEIRTAAKSAVKGLTSEQKNTKSTLIVKDILALEAIKSAEVVALYASLPDEVISSELIEILASQKRVVLPRVAGDDMDFYPYNPNQMEVGAFGITEPQTTDAISPAEIDAIVVPGVAFTANGKRCGRGKGYYDKLLPFLSSYNIGLCYQFQAREEIPSEPFDKRMDEVWTEEGRLY